MRKNCKSMSGEVKFANGKEGQVRLNTGKNNWTQLGRKTLSVTSHQEKEERRQVMTMTR